MDRASTVIAGDARILSRQSATLVQAVARKTSRSVDEVQRVYALEFERLERHASVKIYLPLLAARRALDILSGD